MKVVLSLLLPHKSEKAHQWPPPSFFPPPKSAARTHTQNNNPRDPQVCGKGIYLYIVRYYIITIRLCSYQISCYENEIPRQLLTLSLVPRTAITPVARQSHNYKVLCWYLPLRLLVVTLITLIMLLFFYRRTSFFETIPTGAILSACR